MSLCVLRSKIMSMVKVFVLRQFGLASSVSWTRGDQIRFGHSKNDIDVFKFNASCAQGRLNFLNVSIFVW